MRETDEKVRESLGWDRRRNIIGHMQQGKLEQLDEAVADQFEWRSDVAQENPCRYAKG